MISWLVGSFSRSSQRALLTFATSARRLFPPPTAQNDNLPVHEDKARGVYVKDLTDFYVSSSLEVYEIMRQGGNARAVSATSQFGLLCRVRSIR